MTSRAALPQVLQDWQRGKLPYFVHPPEKPAGGYIKPVTLDDKMQHAPPTIKQKFSKVCSASCLVLTKSIFFLQITVTSAFDSIDATGVVDDFDDEEGAVEEVAGGGGRELRFLF